MLLGVQKLSDANSVHFELHKAEGTVPEADILTRVTSRKQRRIGSLLLGGMPMQTGCIDRESAVQRLPVSRMQAS